MQYNANRDKKRKLSVQPAQKTQTNTLANNSKIIVTKL